MSIDKDTNRLSKEAKEQLLEYMFRDAKSLFPRMELKDYRGGYISPYHIDNGERDSKGQGTIFYRANYIRDYAREGVGYNGGDSLNIFDLYLRQEGKEFKDVFFDLCKQYGIELPSSDPEEFKKWNDRQDLREWAQKTFQEALFSPKGSKALDYMKGRGWTEEEIKKAGLGFVDPYFRNNLEKNNKEKYQTLIEDLTGSVGKGEFIGNPFSLSIPYKNGGTLLGWKFRRIEGEGTKYLGGVSLEKGSYFQGLRNNGGDTLIIVEGDLDCIHAQLRGCPSVAATSGGGVTQRQIQDAMRKGYKYYTLLFDNDERGISFRNKAIETIEREGGRVFCSALPQDVKDTDEYLKNHTGEEFRKVVEENSVPACAIRLDNGLDPYKQKENLNYIDRTRIIDLFRNLIKTTPREDLEFLRKQLSRHSETIILGGNELEEMFRQAEYEKDEQTREDILKKAISDTQALIDRGDTLKATEDLEKTLETLREKKNLSKFEEDFSDFKGLPDLRQFLGNIKEGVPTGILFKDTYSDNHLTIKEGLSFVCGAQGHRKTTFLLNIALNEAERNLQKAQNGEPLRKVLFYSYEMGEKQILISLLNIILDEPTMKTDRMEKPNPLKVIGDYFKGRTEEVKVRGEKYDLERKIDKALNKYILSGAIKIVYVDYRVGRLIESLKYFRGKNEVSLVLVDYVQQIYSEGYHRERTEELKDIVNTLKNYANDTFLPVLMGAQFNRQVRLPNDMVTQNIGEAGDLERIAVDVVGVYNLSKPLLSMFTTTKEIKTKGDVEVRRVLTAEGEDLKKVLLKCKGIGRFSMEMEKQIQEIDPTKIGPDSKLHNLLYLRIMKSRFGAYPIDIILEINDNTGRIKVNKENLLKVEKIQSGDLFEGNTNNTNNTNNTEFAEEDVLPF